MNEYDKTYGVIFQEEKGEETVTITSYGDNRRCVSTYLTHGSGSCARHYNSPEEVIEGYKKDWWCVFNIYSPEQLIRLAWG